MTKIQEIQTTLGVPADGKWGKQSQAALELAKAQSFGIEAGSGKSEVGSVEGNGSYSATKAKVHTRGIPPDSFLDELVAWGRSAPDSIFAPNEKQDVYASVEKELGPYSVVPHHRKAVMLEVLRVLAGFESSWKWTEGVDTTNRTSMAHIEGQETGIFQVSANAVFFDSSLQAFVLSRIGAFHGIGTRYSGFAVEDFITRMKADHAFAIEFASRLLRFTVRHNGPVLRKEINQWLSRAAVAEFERLLA